MVQAHIHLMSQIGTRVTLQALADRMSKAHKRRHFSPGQISQYQGGTVKSYPLEVVWIYAKATGVDPGWLAFGEESEAPSPVPHRPPLESPAPSAPLARKAKSERRRA